MPAIVPSRAVPYSAVGGGGVPIDMLIVTHGRSLATIDGGSMPSSVLLGPKRSIPQTDHRFPLVDDLDLVGQIHS